MSNDQYEVLILRYGTRQTVRSEVYLNHALYHDRFARTADGWRFAERVYEVRYLDTSPLAGSAP